jgi:hypothetical protein
LPNGFKNDSDSLGESGGLASHEDQDLELKKQELELCQTGPKFALKVVEGFLLGYDSNTKAYRVFNKSSGLVEVSSDVVFDETNGSPR